MVSLNILEWIKNKIDKTQIKNTLTETAVGNVLDSTQGKILNDKVGVLSTDRGYLFSKGLTNFNLAKENGKYILDIGTLNAPESGNAYCLDVTKQVGYENLIQEAISYYPTSTPLKYYRLCVNGAFGAWKQVATTDKITEITNLGFGTGLGGLSGTVDLNFVDKNGRFICSSTTNHPSAHNGTYGFLEVVRLDNNWQKQIFTSFHTYKQYFRFFAGGSWGVWGEISNTEKLTPTLLNGWVNSSGTLMMIAKVGNIVTISGIVTNPVSVSNSILFTLPSWASVSRYAGVRVFTYDGASYSAYFTVDPSGNFILQGASNANQLYAISLSYII